MDAAFSPEDETFRARVRDFFDHRYPRHVRDKVARWQRLDRQDYIDWMRSLHEEGWSAINWPEEYGGTGWTPTQKYIFYQEMARADAPLIIPFGLSMVGPIIYTYGSEAQKARFLPDILAANAWWCQGYSEPGAGSDLASLSTRAVRDGNEYIVNGTKTWTTLAQHADWIFCLVRTSVEERKQQGISFLLIDMQSPGVTVRPILTLEGEHEVNEVHLEDVRVPVANLVGEEGKGWSYGKVLLQHERTGIAGVAVSQRRLQRLRQLAADPPADSPRLADDHRFMDRVNRVQIELDGLEYTDLRVLASVATGGAPGAESSILKVRGTELQQAIDELYLDLAAYRSLPHVPEQFTAGYDGAMLGPENYADFASRYFNFRKASIYGGSNEIQRNIVAKHVLGL